MSVRRVDMYVANGTYGSVLACGGGPDSKWAKNQLSDGSTCRFVEEVEGYTPEQIMSMAEAHYADTGHDHI